jgi:hypothetical protein
MPSVDPIVWVLALVVVVVIAVAIYRSAQAKKRTVAFAALAPTIGLNFEGDSALDNKFKTALFNRGYDGQFKNVMNGRFGGFDVSVFDYLFITGSRKSRRTWNQTVVAFSQDVWLPLFAICSEGFFDRIGDAFTHEDIDFDSHPKFSHRYLLRGADEGKIREPFTPALLEFLENIPAQEKWHIEGDGKNLIFYLGDVTIAPEHLQSLLEITSTMAKTFLSSCGRSSFLTSTRTF